MQLRVCSYNVLAQCLAKSSYFTYCKSDTLKWKGRFPRLCSLMGRVNADVFALSEVDQIAAYTEWFQANKYSFVFQQRKGKQYGNLIAWRSERFECVKAAAADLDDLGAAIRAGVFGADSWKSAEEMPEHIAFSLDKLKPATDPTTGAATVGGASSPAEASSAMPPIVLTGGAEDFEKSCAGLLVALQSIPEEGQMPRRFIITCSHLYFEPRSHHVRRAQAAMLQLCAAEFLHVVAEGDHSSIPVFFAGDFNAIPGTSPYQTLRAIACPEDVTYDEALATSAPLAWDVLGKFVGSSSTPMPSKPVDPSWLNRLGAWVAASKCLTDKRVASNHMAGSLSAYLEAHKKGLDSTGETYFDRVGAPLPLEAHLEPAFTTATDTFRAALDYIMYPQTPSVKIQSVLPLPTYEQLAVTEEKFMPSAQHPSDHCILLAEFEVS
jgi:mRNA deadenylase 3'-5' endonuclease subunit Ccr4